MAYIWIEMDRGDGWELRLESEADITAEQLRQELPTYCSRHKARAFLNGILIGEAVPVRGKVVGKLVATAPNLWPMPT
jgi:sRNA-binding protein